MATSKAEIRTVFRGQLEALAATGRNFAFAAALQEQRHWTQIEPGDWSGDLSDVAHMGAAFDREENANDSRNAIRDVQNPGTISDLMASQLQGDYLAAMERAFRARHQTEIRSHMHASARRYGHGAPGGVLSRGVLAYIEGIIKAGKNS